MTRQEDCRCYVQVYVCPECMMAARLDLGRRCVDARCQLELDMWGVKSEVDRVRSVSAQVEVEDASRAPQISTHPSSS